MSGITLTGIDTFDPGKEGVVENPPKLRPKKAATIIITRRDGGAVRVLMGERHSTHAFQSGRFVFPGGALDPADTRLSLPSDLRPDVARRAGFGATPAQARALALAAIRETFEETGVLLGEPSANPPRTRAKAWADFFAQGVVPRLDALDFIGRAITPPKRARRFDTYFFLADASAIAKILDPATVSGELLTPVWPTLAEARELKLPGITKQVLAEVDVRLKEGPGRPAFFFRVENGKPVTTRV
jgi:8-oxo-dGTP pyrophosphatase MutT (NUDIX family)